MKNYQVNELMRLAELELRSQVASDTWKQCVETVRKIKVSQGKTNADLALDLMFANANLHHARAVWDAAREDLFFYDESLKRLLSEHHCH